MIRKLISHRVLANRACAPGLAAMVLTGPASRITAKRALRVIAEALEKIYK